jgi:hypothetical protein
MNLSEQIKKCRIRTKSEFDIIQALAKQARLRLKQEKLERIEIVNDSKGYFFYKNKNPVNYSRPIQSNLYIECDKELNKTTQEIIHCKNTAFLEKNITRVSYTFIQDIATYLDIFAPSGSKKTLGTFFESIVSILINIITGIEPITGTIRLPGLQEKVSWDLLIKEKNKNPLFIATKTSTRERLSQPFVQKLILAKALKQKISAILIVVGDVQRVKNDQIQHTFTAGQFILYSKYIEQLDGVYYMDIPPQADRLVRDGLLSPFSKLVSDLPRLIKNL